MQLYLDELAINDPANGLFMDEEITGITGFPTIRTSGGTNVGRDGGWVSRQLYDARFISWTGRIFSTDKAQAEVIRRNLGAVLARKEVTLKIVTYGGSSYQTKVNVMDFTSPISRNMNLYEYKIDLKQNDPIWYDNTSDGDLIAKIGKEKQDGFLIPFTFPLPIGGSSGDAMVVNNGNSAVLPRIFIPDAASNPELINKTSGHSIKANIVLNDGDNILIDMAQKTIARNVDVDEDGRPIAGTGTSIYGLLDDTSTFFSLLVGNNLMSLVTDVSSEETIAYIYYNSGYISI